VYKLEGRGLLVLNIFLRKLQLTQTILGMTGDVSWDRYTETCEFQKNKYPN